jgi:hypothetical protein
MAKAEETKPKPKEEPEMKKKTSSSLLLILLIAIFTVAGYLLVWPEYGRLVDAQEKIISQKKALEDESNSFRGTNKLIENYADISSEKREKIEMMLPSEVDEAGLFSLFESLAQKNKIIVLAVDISEKEAAGDLKNLGVSEVQVSLNLTAGPDSENAYGDFKNFLADLEENLRLIDLISINYTPETTSYTLNLKTYRIVPTQSSSAAVSF